LKTPQILIRKKLDEGEKVCFSQLIKEILEDSEISGSHGGECEDDFLLASCAM
jgi:hypothetical protein